MSWWCIACWIWGHIILWTDWNWMRQTGMFTNAISQPQLVYHRRSWTDGSKQKHVPETSISESDVKTLLAVRHRYLKRFHRSWWLLKNLCFEKGFKSHLLPQSTVNTIVKHALTERLVNTWVHICLISFGKSKNNLPEGDRVLPLDVKLSVENVNGVCRRRTHCHDARVSLCGC